MSIELTDLRRLLERAQTGGGAKEILKVLTPQDKALPCIEERLEALKRYWRCFSDLHATQTEQGRSLWGLVDQRKDTPAVHILGKRVYENPYQNRLWEKLLPKDLQADIGRLWHFTVDRKEPSESFVEPFPQALMAEAFGPALSFWHGCALTAWFVAEGPISRTPLSSLGPYYQKLLDALQVLECPVNPSLFSELTAAEIRQGPPAPFTRNLGSGGGITVSISIGSKTGGFDKYRSIITRFRNEWTLAYLDAYLQARVSAEVATVVDFLGEIVSTKDSVPTAATVAKQSRHVINHWFGGTAAEIYECFPISSRRRIRRRPEPEAIEKHSYRKAATVLRNISKDPPWLRFALIGGPPDFHVNSIEWATAAVTVADRILKIERRFMQQAFGFVFGFDFAHTPIRDVVRQVTGVAPTLERQDSHAPSRKETLPARPPRRGRWYIGQRRWAGIKRPPAVYVFSVERVAPDEFENVSRGLWNAALRNHVPPPLIVMPDGIGGRPDWRPSMSRNPATGAQQVRDRDCELDRLSHFLPSQFVQAPWEARPHPQLTSVVLETGRRVPAKTFEAVLTYLESQHDTALTVWDVLGDPLLSEVALGSDRGQFR